MNPSSKYYEIREAALALKDEERAALADDLLTSVPEREITPEEGAEWNRRLEELESGKVRGIPLEETLENVRAALRRARANKISSGSRS